LTFCEALSADVAEELVHLTVAIVVDAVTHFRCTGVHTRVGVVAIHCATATADREETIEIGIGATGRTCTVSGSIAYIVQRGRVAIITRASALGQE